MNAVGATVRLFLLEDQEIVRMGMRALVASDVGLEIVGEAATAAEALVAIPSTRPDVAVLDVRLPDGDGIEVCREIRSRWPEVACLIFTAFADEAASLAAVMAGAAGYVCKGVSGPDFADAVRRVGSGESLIDPASAERLVDNLRDKPAPDNRLERLSRQERHVLDLIATGCTNQQIARRLHLSEKTVKNYVSRVLAKLDVQGRTAAAVLSLRQGPRSD